CVGRAGTAVLAGTHVDVRLEYVGMRGTDAGIDSISTDDQVVVGISGDVFCLRLQLDLDPERERPLPKNIQQALAANAGKPVTARAHSLPAIMHRDIVPVDER